MTNINLGVAGATGWMGSAIVDAALAAPDITLKSAIARSSAGQDLGVALGREPLGIPVHRDVTDALDGIDVLVEFTSHADAKEIVLAAIAHGVAVVIGASGLSAADYEEVDSKARAAGVGAIAAGNFSLTAAMMLEYLGHQDPADEIERAVVAAIDAGETTHDLGGALGTKAAGEAIARRL